MPEVRTAEKYAAEGNWDGAVAAYRAAVKKDPMDRALNDRLNQAKSRAAEQHYAQGRKYLKASQIMEALNEFKLALGLDPSRSEHHVAMGEALRLKEARDQVQAGEKLLSLGRYEDALGAYERAVELDPGLTQAVEAITTITQQQRAAEMVGSSTQPVTLRFQNAKLKEVFEILARAGGLNVVFDKDVRDEPITIFIKDMPFDEALNLIVRTNGLFSRRVSPDTLLLMPNTKQKQDQFQDLMIRTFYLSNAKAKDMVNLLRTMLETKRVYVNEPINALVVRDQPAKLQLAERIITANDRREGEVELDLEVLEISRTKSLKYGLNYAKSAGFGVVPPGFTGGVTANTSTFTWQQLTDLGPESFILTLPSSVILDFFKQESDAKTLASPKLRVLNGKQGSVNIGDKQPILLSTTNVLPGQAATGAVPTTSTVTSIEFKDVGIKLSVEPTIHLMDELTLKLKVEVTRLGDLVTLQSNPLIQQFRFGTRTAETILNMKNDESIILAGLIQDEERKTIQTVPGLGDIPVLGKLFTSTQTDVITTEVVLTITPRLVRNVTMPGPETQAFWSGSEGQYATAPMFSAVSRNGNGKLAATPIPPAPIALPKGSPGTGGMSMPAASPTPQSVPPKSPTASGSGPAGTPSTPPSAPTVQPGPPAPPPLVARGASVLALRPSESAATVGQEFQIEVTAEQLTGLSESVLTLAYDSSALEFRRALEGEFLTQGGTPAALTISANPGAGQVALHLRRQGPPSSGGGGVARLFFQAKAPGSFPITMQQATVSGADGKPIPVTMSAPAVIRVRSGP
jgi:general secretion pathway protein D